MLPFMLGIMVPMGFLFFYSVICASNSSQESRYVYPMLVCLVILFGRGQAVLQARGWHFLAAAGTPLAWGFILLSVYFFWHQPV